MAHKTVLMILILGVAILSGCVDNPDSTVYLDKKTNHTLTLYSDKTFAEQETSGTYSGVYRIDGNQIVLTFQAFGLVINLQKDGDKLVYTKDGTVWEKVQ